jgi:hypothetical protein
MVCHDQRDPDQRESRRGPTPTGLKKRVIDYYSRLVQNEIICKFVVARPEHASHLIGGHPRRDKGELAHKITQPVKLGER